MILTNVAEATMRPDRPPVAPAAQCVAMIASSMDGRGMGHCTESLMSDSQDAYLMPAMSGIAIGLFDTVAALVGERRALEHLEDIGFAAARVDAELAELFADDVRRA